MWIKMWKFSIIKGGYSNNTVFESSPIKIIDSQGWMKL